VWVGGVEVGIVGGGGRLMLYGLRRYIAGFLHGS
jgi:hypothetical protein